LCSELGYTYIWKKALRGAKPFLQKKGQPRVFCESDHHVPTIVVAGETTDEDESEYSTTFSGSNDPLPLPPKSPAVGNHEPAVKSASSTDAAETAGGNPVPKGKKGKRLTKRKENQ
jgi:hypothetical protein